MSYNISKSGIYIEEMLLRASVISNKNLLHNWDFRNPVNQRGASSYTAIGYTIDRWFTDPNVMVAINAEGYINLTLPSGTFNSFYQLIENTKGRFNGKIMTLSTKIATSARTGLAVGYKDGSGVFQLIAFKLFTNSTYEIVSFSFTVPEGIGSYPLWVKIGADLLAATAQVESIKLELGSVSTLANDPPADYGEELRKCQRYYQVLDGYYAVGAAEGDGLHLGINLRVPMRATPAFTQDTINSQIAGAGGNDYYTDRTLSYKWGSHESLTLLMANPDTTKMIPNCPVSARLDGKLRFSADL